MKITFKFAALAIFPFAMTVAHAQVKVEEPWLRATVPHQASTAVFMKISAAEPLRLIGARSPAAGRAEVHEMTMDQGVMKMRPLPALELPAGKTVALTPGGYHVMLFELRKQVVPGDAIPLTLVFEDRDKKRSSVDVLAQARALNDPAMPMQGASPPR